VGFKMRVGSTRVRGSVDRICIVEGRPVLVDYKTNASLDQALVDAYSVQLRLYGLAAQHGLLPCAGEPRLVLFDLRQGRTIEVEPEPAAVVERVTEAAARIAAGDFELRPEHAARPCSLCAYRRICRDARP
jgi:CRISPR/Cas system-associated exonuclease Cas4 (RecB family)